MKKTKAERLIEFVAAEQQIKTENMTPEDAMTILVAIGQLSNSKFKGILR